MEAWYASSVGKKHIKHARGYPECFTNGKNSGKRTRLDASSEEDIIETLRAHMGSMRIANKEIPLMPGEDPNNEELMDTIAFKEFDKLLAGEALLALPPMFETCGIKEKEVGAGGSGSGSGKGGNEDDEMFPIVPLDDDHGSGVGVGLASPSSSSAFMPMPRNPANQKRQTLPPSAPSFKVMYTKTYPFVVKIAQPQPNSAILNSFIKASLGKKIANSTS